MRIEEEANSQRAKGRAPFFCPDLFLAYIGVHSAGWEAALSLRDEVAGFLD